MQGTHTEVTSGLYSTDDVERVGDDCYDFLVKRRTFQPCWQQKIIEKSLGLQRTSMKHSMDGRLKSCTGHTDQSSYKC